MKESLLSFEEKTHSWFTYFQIADKFYNAFKTYLLNIIFYDFSIW